jgi:hypothetical protein
MDAVISEPFFPFFFKAWKASPGKSEFHIFIGIPYSIFTITTIDLKTESGMTGLL